MSYDPDTEEPPIIITIHKIEHETNDALLVHDGKGKFWVPKSLIIEQTNEDLAIASWFEINYLKG